MENIKNESGGLLSVPEAAEYLRISVRKLNYIIQAKEIAVIRIDKRVLFKPSDLDSFIESKRVDKK